MAATAARSKSLEDHMDKQDSTMQQMQGKVSQLRGDFQTMCAQMSDLNYKVSALFAEWQQQRGSSVPTSSR